ncbi:unnamed protein product [Bubo scandiacus]
MDRKQYTLKLSLDHFQSHFFLCMDLILKNTYFTEPSFSQMSSVKDKGAILAYVEGCTVVRCHFVIF